MPIYVKGKKAMEKGFKEEKKDIPHINSSSFKINITADNSYSSIQFTEKLLKKDLLRD